MEWLDEFFEEEECTLRQIADIENLLRTSSAAYKYERLELSDLTHEQAKVILADLWAEDNPLDPREQFKRMFN